jgi:polyhydroxyalkanoate synthesis regulator phasin
MNKPPAQTVISRRGRGILAPNRTLHILQAMYRYVMLAALTIASANVNVFSQDAAAIAAQREAEERERRMNSLIENLQQANTVQQRRINELNNDVAALRRQLVEFENRYKNAQLGAVSQTDLRKIYDTMDKIENNRQSDNKLVKEQFQELRKILEKQPAYVEPIKPIPPPSSHREKPTKDVPSDQTQTQEPQGFTGEYYPYTIKSGDILTRVIAAYNAQLKEKGANKAPITLDMVKKANPKINPNNLPVGKEIKIPIPPDK